MKNTSQLFIRNSGYISEEIQNKIFNTRLLIAGCGVGSQMAVAAARVGFQKFTLIDGDTIEAHNLNRQAYFYDDIGKSKVQALKEHILRINPNAEVVARHELLNEKNCDELVKDCDYVFDTIDFLDLPGILALHDAANRHNKYLLSCFSAGWGGCMMIMRPDLHGPCHLRKMFNLTDSRTQKSSYTEVFFEFADILIPHLMPKVQADMRRVLEKMKDKQPCPASHVVVGSLSVANLGVTALFDLIAGLKVNDSGDMIIYDHENIVNLPGVYLCRS